MRLFHGRRTVIAVILLTLFIAIAAITYLRGQTSGSSTRMVAVDTFQMRVRSQGLDQRQSTKPVVVLESGAGTGLETWDSVFARIAEVPVLSQLGLSAIRASEHCLTLTDQFSEKRCPIRSRRCGDDDS
jgi:hypothetical protein